MATLDQLIDRFIPVIRDAFRAAIADVVNRAILIDVTRAIENGDVEAAFRALGFSDAAMRPITAAVERAFEEGGVTVAGTFPRRLNSPAGRTVFRFDVRDSRAEAWLRDESSRLVTRLTEDARVTVRNVVTEGMREGSNPRTTALDLVGRMNITTKRREGGVVGLTPQYERAVSRARSELRQLDPNYFNRERRDKRFDATVRKAIKYGTPLPEDVINKLAGRYSDSLLQLRGETIARTESIAALNRSEYEAIKQAIDQGTINQTATVRIWDTAGDNRVRHSHRTMDGQTVGVNEPFTTPTGAKLMYPGDTSMLAPGSETINCRCRVRLKVDWLADLGNDDPLTRSSRIPQDNPSSITPVLPPPETPIQRNNRLDIDLKRSVLDNGRQSGVEYLEAYDAKTGKIFTGNTGKESSVSIPPEMMAAMQDDRNELIVHHNHPGSRSFSEQDLHVTMNYAGMKGIYAHGHNGSTYYAERGTRKYGKTDYKKALKDTQSGISYAIARKKMTVEDATILHHHTTAMLLNERNKIKYIFNLQGETASAFERSKDVLEEMVKVLK